MITSGTFWSSSRARHLLQIRNGKVSARSPKHFPIEEATRIKLERIAARKALAAAEAEVQAHIDVAQRLLGSTREQS
jgi:hypothetical protein